MQRSTTAKCLYQLGASPNGVVIDADGKWNWANVKPASEPAPVLKNSPNSFTFGPPEVKLKYEALAPGFDQQAEEKSSRAFSRYEGKL